MVIKLKKISMILFEIMLVFLLFQHYVFPSEMTFISLLLTIVTGGLLILCDGKVYINPFFKSYAIFLLVMLVYYLIGYGVGNALTQFMICLMQFVSSIFIYNYLMRINKVEHFFKLFIIISIISLFLIFLILGETAITSRLGHNGSGGIVSYYIAGVPIYKSSNTTANCCAIGVLFLFYYVEKLKRWYCYIPIVFLTLGVLLSGSRKGLLALGIFVIYSYFLMNKGITIKKILLLVLVPTIGYIVLMKIPVVYEAVGIRIESLVMNLYGQTNALDGHSYLTREKLKEVAWEWIREKPLFGYGYSVFAKELGYGAENNILQILLNFGCIGVCAYYGFIIPLTKTLLRDGRKTDATRMVSILILAILIQDYGSVTYSWQTMTIWYSVFWAIINRETGRNNYCKLSFGK